MGVLADSGVLMTDIAAKLRKYYNHDSLLLAAADEIEGLNNALECKDDECRRLSAALAEAAVLLDGDGEYPMTARRFLALLESLQDGDKLPKLPITDAP